MAGHKLQLEKSFSEEVPVPILFCDTIQVSSAEDGVILTIAQTTPPFDTGQKKAVVRPISRVMISWSHFEKVALIVNEVLADHHKELGKTKS